MTEQYTEEQEAIRRMVRDFARKEIAPGAAERDATGRFDYDLYRRLGDLGITGMTFPEEYGGNGDRKSTRLNSSHIPLSCMPSSA